MDFIEYLLEHRREKSLQFFVDIETLKYNTDGGIEKPTNTKVMTYSFAISYIERGEVYTKIFPNIQGFFDTITETFKKWKTTPHIKLNYHNGNKYDNHFLVYDLKHFYPHIKVENIYLRQANEDGNELSTKIKDITPEDKQGLVLEKRVKSLNNLELTFFLYGIRYSTVDNWMKTNASIDFLGNKMLTLGVITEEELKTEFNYTEFDKKNDLTESEAREYVASVFQGLSESHLKYIRNDVIILAKSVQYYSKIFKGFDYSKMTFTSNILTYYNESPLTSLQLLNRFGQGKDKEQIQYTDYKFANENYYDWLKPFYRGGLNFYNQTYLEEVIQDVFSMDIRSSYPYAMHNFDVPTFFNRGDWFEQEKQIPLNTVKNEFTLYRMTKQAFDREIIGQIKSRVLKQMLVKYYSTSSDFININTYTLHLIHNITDIVITELPVLSYVVYDCVPFNSKEHISYMYEVKTKGKAKNQLIYNSPYDIQETTNENTEIFTPEEYDNSKVMLNGLYGIPALRPYYNLFRQVGTEYKNYTNGFKNNERNIVFSIFVTGVALWNLLSPLKNLTPKEIDENFLYCDTDSLYLKKDIQHKIDPSIFHDYNLGSWDLENEQIDKFIVLNHKKYAYETDGEINIRSAGIPTESFDTEMSFEEFVNTQFKHGVEIKNTKSIYTKQKTISIYESTTQIERGSGYTIYAYDPIIDEMKEKMLERIRERFKHGNSDDVLYIESPFGTYSFSDLYPVTNEVKNKLPLIYLKLKTDSIRNKLNT